MLFFIFISFKFDSNDRCDNAALRLREALMKTEARDLACSGRCCRAKLCCEGGCTFPTDGCF